MRKMYCFLFVLLSLCLRVSAQVGSEPMALVSGQSVEREIVGGQTHTYQLLLTAGQFMRVVVEQKGIDVAVALVVPDGKQLIEVNLVHAGNLESLSYEAESGGNYQVKIRNADVRNGTYQVQLEMRTAATAQDKQRIAAERLLIEVDQLTGQTSLQQRLEKSQQALALWRELGDRYWEAFTLNLLGDLQRTLRRYEQAIGYYSQALAVRRELKDQRGEAITLFALGNAYRLLAQHEKAIEYLNQSLAIRRALKDRRNEANTLALIGGIYGLLGRPEKNLEYQEQELAIRRELKDKSEEANTLRNIGITQYHFSYEKAVGYFEQSLAIRREIKDRRGEGEMLSTLGGAYAHLSNYTKAIEYYEQTLAINREIKNRGSEMGSYIELGAAYLSLHRSEKAVESFEHALTIARENKFRDSEATVLNWLGRAWRELGNRDKALEYHEKALVIVREINFRPGEGSTLASLGDSYQLLRRFEKALECYEQSLSIAIEIKNLYAQAGILNAIGIVYRSIGQYQNAITYHEQSLRLAREIKVRKVEAIALNDLMTSWQANKQPHLAIFFGKQSVNLHQETRDDIRSFDRETQQGFLKSKEDSYRTLADLLISQGRLPEAEQVIRMLKEEEYFEYIRRDETNAPKAEKAALTPEEAALDKRYREIADKLTEIGTERNALLDKKSRTPEEEQRLTKLEADLVVAGQAFQKFLDGLAAEMSKNADANARAFQLRESQGLMEDLRELGKGVVALYTLVGEDKYRVILTTADFQKGYEYPIKAEELNRKVLAFRDVLQNPKLDPLPLAQELYKILVGPVAKDLQGTKAQMVMWSLDGVLRYLPVAALHDGKQYLVERFRTAVFTPASQSRLRVEPSRKWTALGLGVTKAHGLTIPALPGVLEEMRGIIQEAGAKTGVLPGSIKLDEAFTQEAMLSELRKRNPVVHIASHFRFQPGNETNSALLLGDGQFLSLAQIKSLPNVFAGVDLLTLSACNTATGGSGANGKEVEGFGVLAQRQGAKAVVASLWPVADRSTKNLMQEFYKLREAKAEVTKIEALRQAQIKLLRGELQVTGETLAAREIVHEAPKATNQPPFKPDTKAPYAHPYYWAPFILIGNWK
ncbi:MAG: CHAT domain-containing protein [Acidobacteria bacterium]|nr:CHAT domain-containing protein [Acidobacteriota bacterium]